MKLNYCHRFWFKNSILLIKFDKINTQALPVLVYELNTKAVAWYDIEMFMGHA